MPIVATGQTPATAGKRKVLSSGRVGSSTLQSAVGARRPVQARAPAPAVAPPTVALSKTGRPPTGPGMGGVSLPVGAAMGATESILAPPSTNTPGFNEDLARFLPGAVIKPEKAQKAPSAPSTGLVTPVGRPLNEIEGLDFTQLGAMEALYPEIKPLLTDKSMSEREAEEILNSGRLSSDTATAGFVGANMDEFTDSDFAKWMQEYGLPLLSAPTTGETTVAGLLPGLAQPTMGEEVVAQTLPELEDPLFGEGFTEQAVTEAYGNQPEMENRADALIPELQAAIPELALDPDLGAFYDRATQSTVDTLNRQLGARGAYGSSGGLGMISDSVQGLAAERANREADYRLNRAAELRGWQSLISNTAGMADLQDARMSQEERQWLSSLIGAAQSGDALTLERLLGAAGIALDAGKQGLERTELAGELALGAGEQGLERTGMTVDAMSEADQQELARLLAGLQATGQVDEADLARVLATIQLTGGADAAKLGRLAELRRAAEGAQEFQTTRGQNLFDNLMRYGGSISDIIGGGMDDIVGTDIALTDAELAALLGGQSEAVSAAINQANMSSDSRSRNLDNAADVLALMKALEK